VASRTSPSSIERRQARGFLRGLVGLVGATLLFALFDTPGSAGSAATVGAALSPLPLGYAIARHHLFDLDLDVRRAAAQLVSSMTMAALLFLPLFAMRDVLDMPSSLRPAPFIFAAVFCTMLPLDLLRRGVAASVESALRPRGIAWEDLARDPAAEQLSDARDPEGVARVASELLERGFPGTDNAIFFAQEDDLVVAHATGSGACADSTRAAQARAALPARPVDLNRLALGPTGERLYEIGIEASSPILRGEDLLGWILVSPRRRGMFLSSGHLGFLASIASQAAAALHHLRLVETLLVTERFAAQGRVHAELAHELGKPLGTLEVLSRRLAQRGGRSTDDARAAASIARLASQLRGIVRGALAEPASATAECLVPVGELMEQARREVSNVRGEEWVVTHPPVRAMWLPARCRRLIRALTNLLDNAIDASVPGQAVDLRVRSNGDEIVFEVADTGAGIAEDRLARVMDPFVTSREGGTGLGLAIARDIVEALGGKLRLGSMPGVGTCARIHMPAHRA